MERILVIEDEQDIREHIVKILQYEGFEAVCAENGRIGIERAQQERPDLIICDVLMPEVSGYGVLTELRTNPRTATIPFIFLTARSSNEDIRHGMKLGADDYLTKPFKVSDLLEAVHTRLQKHAVETHQLDELRQSLSQALPHELKTPLTAIIGFTDFLLHIDRAMLPDIDEIIEMQRSINECALRLEHLIENYLLYANLQLTDHDSEKRQAWKSDNILSNLSSFINYVVPEKVEDLQRRNDLTYEIENATLQISEQHLSKILEELLENACKFSEPGTPITILGARQDDRYVLSIRDRGHGMTEEQIARVGAYMQFDRKIYEQQGMGLGLQICRKLTQLYDGDLSLESVPDQGTTVTLTLKTRV